MIYTITDCFIMLIIVRITINRDMVRVEVRGRRFVRGVCTHGVLAAVPQAGFRPVVLRDETKL